MGSRLLTMAMSIWAAIGGTALAGSPVVVELFTSQGCSSCPPADKLLGEIAERDDVIALALHVDYWDYIGWKDSFAKPQFTNRQKNYAHAAGERSIYTPQIVVEGQDHVVGSKAMELAKYIEHHADATDPVLISLRRSGGKLGISAKLTRAASPEMVVQLVTYTPRQTVEIKRGENAGKTLTYHNIVRDWIVVGTWDGSSDFTASVPVPSGLHVAVLVQERNAGRMLGAAKAR